MTTKHLSLLQRRMIVIVTLAASFLSVLMMFFLLTAFPKIMEEFSLNSTQVQWLTTSFMLTVAIFIPITAYLIDTFKTRTLMIGAMFLFFIGTLISFIAPSFSLLLIGRMIQGIASGIMIPLMQTILFLVYPREKRGYALGLAGMIINVAPAIGPPISGMIIKYFEWRTLFLITLIIAGIILVLVIFFMHNVTKQRETTIDILSIILSSIGFGGVLYGFNELQESGLDHILTLTSLTVGSIALGLFVYRQLRSSTPILELRMLKIPVFVLTSFIAILAFSLLISTETILPMYVQNAQGLSAYYGGLVVMPGALALAVTSLLAGNLFDKYGGKALSIIGFIITGVSAIGFYFILDLNTTFMMAATLFTVSMIGMAFISMPIITAGINALPDELIPHGTSVINTIRQFGGTIGLTFIISFITKAESSAVGINQENYLAGVKTAFLVTFIFTVVGLLLSFFMKKGESGIS